MSSAVGSELRAAVPEGWLTKMPNQTGDGLPPDDCVAYRKQIMRWLSDGMTHVELCAADAPKDYAAFACWSGKVVEVPYPTAAMGFAMLHIAQDAANERGFELHSVGRNDFRIPDDLPADPMARAVGLNCEHDGCSQTAVLIMASPVTNAAAEIFDPTAGFVSPATLIQTQLELSGCGSLMKNEGGEREWSPIYDDLCTRLGIDRDLRKQKPIHNGDLAVTEDGYVVARRPTRPPRSKLPDHETVVGYFAGHPEGVTVVELADHFNISKTGAKRVLDALSPEFICSEMPARCIRVPWNHKVWKISADRDEIDAYINDYGRTGHELAVFVQTTPNGELVLSHDVTVVW